MASERLTVGIDAGSSSVKVAAYLNAADGSSEELALATQRIRRRNVADVVRQTFDEACAVAHVAEGDVDYLASTGDGDAVPFRTGHFYSMTTHARGALHLVPAARALIDVGALHARAMRIDERSRVVAHRMTSQCASGSGQFLENIARYLGVPLEDVGPLSCTARKPEAVSSICAVLAETDVINMVSRGLTTADILKGIHDSIAGRLARLIRATGSEGTVLVTGGLSCDSGLLQALREALQMGKPLDVVAHDKSIYAGAIGAALLGAYRHNQLARLGRLPQADTAAEASSAATFGARA